jgi:O-antigen chain-terminating methyltransferase
VASIDRLGRLEERAGRFDASLDTVEATLDSELPEIGAALSSLTDELGMLQGEVESLRDRRLVDHAARLDAAESSLRGQQDELEQLRDARTASLEQRADVEEQRLRDLGREVSRLRDEVVPAIVDRGNALVDRLADELEEVASLTSRLALREPLPVAVAEPLEARLEAGLAEVQSRVLEAFRGDEHEIHHRLDRYLGLLTDAAPVLDLGCGRGELLTLLREAGVDATGVESDRALVAEARRRGLRVEAGDVLAVLEQQPDAGWGAATAIHLLEHLPPPVLLATLQQVRRVLRPAGVMVVECPNPHSLRVGAALYWRDPTHQHPLLPETLELFLSASGFDIVHREALHPFPEEQLLSTPSDGATAQADDAVAQLARRLDRLTHELDELLNGPRDFSIVARAPGPSIE